MYGIIDIGSNTIRLAVYKIENSRPKPLFSKKFTAGLASYINKNGALSKKGIDKAVSTLKQFTPILENVSLNAVYVFATASLRNIRNSEYALKTISRRSGLDIQLISGETEGILGFSGANLQSSLGSGLMTDIGSGSTEEEKYFEMYEDIRTHMAATLHKRKRLQPVRLETTGILSDKMQKYLCRKLQ